jgi:hypothetical protein
MYKFHRWIASKLNILDQGRYSHGSNFTTSSTFLTAIMIAIHWTGPSEHGGQRHIANAALAFTSRPPFVFDRLFESKVKPCS